MHVQRRSNTEYKMEVIALEHCRAMICGCSLKLEQILFHGALFRMTMMGTRIRPHCLPLRVSTPRFNYFNLDADKYNLIVDHASNPHHCGVCVTQVVILYVIVNVETMASLTTYNCFR